jgi:hypothetical protein
MHCRHRSPCFRIPTADGPARRQAIAVSEARITRTGYRGDNGWRFHNRASVNPEKQSATAIGFRSCGCGASMPDDAAQDRGARKANERIVIHLTAAVMRSFPRCRSFSTIAVRRMAALPCLEREFRVHHRGSRRPDDSAARCGVVSALSFLDLSPGSDARSLRATSGRDAPDASGTGPHRQRSPSHIRAR